MEDLVKESCWLNFDFFPYTFMAVGTKYQFSSSAYVTYTSH